VITANNPVKQDNHIAFDTAAVMIKSRMPQASPSIDRATPRRRQVQDVVLQKICSGLMVGAFVPGQVMSLRKLAASLGTSPMPVREAFKQLVGANALEELPNHSVRVPRLSAERIAELFSVREVVEGMAAKAACVNVTPSLIQHLETINRELIGAISKRDILACLAKNQTFHFTLYAAANSETLKPLIESLWLQCGPTMYFSLLSPEMLWDASAHAEILQGLKAKKPAVVQRALAKDMRTTAKNLLRNAHGPHLDGLAPVQFGNLSAAF
jgi:DNA-binding GntR family transcriptional regulator